MLRHLIAACAIAQLAGCVIVPTHVTPPPPSAAIGQLRVVVPQPDVGAHAMYVGEVPWHFARLTLSPTDAASAPTVQTLSSSRSGDLVANGPIENLRPGAYTARVDLIQLGYNGVEHVVASGQLAQQLVVGNGNSLQVMVHPTEVNSHVALTPTALPQVGTPYWSGTNIVNTTTIYERPTIVQEDTEVVVQADEPADPVLHVQADEVQHDDGADGSADDGAAWDDQAPDDGGGTSSGSDGSSSDGSSSDGSSSDDDKR